MAHRDDLGPVVQGRGEHQVGLDHVLVQQFAAGEAAAVGAVLVQHRGGVVLHRRADMAPGAGRLDQDPAGHPGVQPGVQLTPGEPLGDRRAADVAGAHVQDPEVVQRPGSHAQVRRYAGPGMEGGGRQLPASRSGTTSLSCSTEIAPALSSTGTLPVTSTIDEAWAWSAVPPSR